MPKYNILSGHKRYRIPLGEKSHPRENPSLGWRLECDCGYQVEGLKNKRELESIYAAHIKESLPICRICKETKHPRFMSIAQHTMCKKCNTAGTKQRMMLYPDRGKHLKQKSHLLKKFNLTIEEYNNILFSQKYLCAICKFPLERTSKNWPHTDHCHETGKVRGILCSGCNLGLGSFKDDPNRLFNAVNYLLKHRQK